MVGAAKNVMPGQRRLSVISAGSKCPCSGITWFAARSTCGKLHARPVRQRRRVQHTVVTRDLVHVGEVAQGHGEDVPVRDHHAFRRPVVPLV